MDVMSIGKLRHRVDARTRSGIDHGDTEAQRDLLYGSLCLCVSVVILSVALW